MSTIKDVAKLAGVSISTVSIVINGKARERSIPQETCDRINAAIAELGYRPNNAARRLRSRDKLNPLIGFFWPSSRNFDEFATYLEVFELAKDKLGFKCDISLQVYNTTDLKDLSLVISAGIFDAILIHQPEAEDVEFLKSRHLNIPVVIINRHYEDFPCVEYDRNKVAIMTSEMLKKKGISKVTMVGTSFEQDVKKSRLWRALMELKGSDISIEHGDIIVCKRSIAGGYEAGLDYDPKKHASCIVAESDLVARGFIRAMHEKGYEIPKDYTLLTYAVSRMDNSKYFIPALTEIVLPLQKVVQQALELVKDGLAGKNIEGSYFQSDPMQVYRESFPE